MAAPAGNEFWKLRLVHGRKRVIKSPKALWENALEYFEWCESSPLMQAEQLKSPPKPFKTKDEKDEDGNVIPGHWIVPPLTIELPKMRPFTKGGFALACGLNSWKEIDSLRSVSEDFSNIISRIEAAIYEQKFSGAAAGFFNPSIIARDLNLREKTDTEISGKDGKPIEHTYEVTLKL